MVGAYSSGDQGDSLEGSKLMKSSLKNNSDKDLTPMKDSKRSHLLRNLSQSPLLMMQQRYQKKLYAEKEKKMIEIFQKNQQNSLEKISEKSSNEVKSYFGKKTDNAKHKENPNCYRENIRVKHLPPIAKSKKEGGFCENETNQLNPSAGNINKTKAKRSCKVKGERSRPIFKNEEIIDKEDSFEKSKNSKDVKRSTFHDRNPATPKSKSFQKSNEKARHMPKIHLVPKQNNSKEHPAKVTNSPVKVKSTTAAVNKKVTQKRPIPNNHQIEGANANPKEKMVRINKSCLRLIKDKRKMEKKFDLAQLNQQHSTRIECNQVVSEEIVDLQEGRQASERSRHHVVPKMSARCNIKSKQEQGFADKNQVTSQMANSQQLQEARAKLIAKNGSIKVDKADQPPNKNGFSDEQNGAKRGQTFCPSRKMDRTSTQQNSNKREQEQLTSALLDMPNFTKPVKVRRGERRNEGRSTSNSSRCNDVRDKRSSKLDNYTNHHEQEQLQTQQLEYNNDYNQQYQDKPYYNNNGVYISCNQHEYYDDLNQQGQCENKNNNNPFGTVMDQHGYYNEFSQHYQHEPNYNNLSSNNNPNYQSEQDHHQYDQECHNSQYDQEHDMVNQEIHDRQNCEQEYQSDFKLSQCEDMQSQYYANEKHVDHQQNYIDNDDEDYLDHYDEQDYDPPQLPTYESDKEHDCVKGNNQEQEFYNDSLEKDNQNHRISENHYEELGKGQNNFDQSRSASMQYNNIITSSNGQEVISYGEEQLHPCDFCGRKFLADRLDRHKQVCQSSPHKKKRKVYNMEAARKKGTDLENFVPDPQPKSALIKIQKKKANWRATHNDLLETIKYAKKVSEHTAAGGKITDLPPPPPSTNRDYVQCEFCQRKFAPKVAERHIPKCKEIKARPAPPSKRKLAPKAKAPRR